MSRLEIRVLGAPSVALDGATVDTSRHKAIALLAYLAVTGERQRREALAALFWPDYEPSKAFAYLRRTLWEIKEVLGEGWVVADREVVGLEREAERWLDLAEFRRALAAAATHGHAPAAVCVACIEPLGQAVALYRGDFLEGFSLRDSPGFDDWQFYLAEGLRQEAAAALQKLSAISGRERRLDLAVDYGRRWLALDPLNEACHRQLMLLLALSGQRSAAMRQYRECVRILQEEMGIAPERRTTELFERIEQGRVPTVETGDLPISAAAPASGGAAGGLAQPHHSLPQVLTPFIGRQEELGELDDLLADPNVRLLSILAVGGMGKTRLAIETAARRMEWSTHGVVFMPLAPLQSAVDLVPALADRLELAPREGIPQKTQVLDYLREKSLLLVMDNFEHLLVGSDGEQSVDLVREILQAAPGVKVLVTSRMPLNLQEEHRYHLGGMDFPITERQANALETDAVRLFLQGARRALPRFRLVDGDLPHAIAICQLADGMPLGILLAAGWVELLALGEIATAMRSQRDFLETDMQDVPERHRSMRVVLQQAWDLLSDQEREALECLSVFRGSFDRQAAQEVSGASLRQLMSLVNKSMVTRLANDRLVLHEMLRQYAAERLGEDLSAFVFAHDRHSALYCRRLQAWVQAVKRPGRPLSMTETEADLENLRAAWTWATIDRQVDRLADSAEGLGWLLSWQGRSQNGEAAFELAIDALEPPADDEERVVLAYLLAWQALFASSRLGAVEIAVLMDRAFAWLDVAGDLSPRAMQARAFVMFARGRMALTVLNHRDAQNALEESLHLYECIGDDWWIAVVLEQLGSAAWTRNDLDQTKAFFQRSLAARRKIGDEVGMAGLLNNLAALAGFDGGQVEEAVELYRESSRLYTAIGGRTGELSALASAQAVERLSGRFVEAVTLIQRQVGLASELGDRAMLNDIRMTLAETLQLMGQYDLAVAEHRKNIASLTESGWTAPETWVRTVFGAALLGLGSYEEARQVLAPNIAVLEDSHSTSMLGRTLAALSRTELGLGHVDIAWKHVLRSVELLSGRHYFWLLEAMAAAAAALAVRGEVERAVEIEAILNRHPYVANSRWFAGVFQSLVEAAAAGMPPEDRAAARARGEGMDLWQAAKDLLAAYGSTDSSSSPPSVWPHTSK